MAILYKAQPTLYLRGHSADSLRMAKSALSQVLMPEAFKLHNCLQLNRIGAGLCLHKRNSFS